MQHWTGLFGNGQQWIRFESIQTMLDGLNTDRYGSHPCTCLSSSCTCLSSLWQASIPSLCWSPIYTCNFCCDFGFACLLLREVIEQDKWTEAAEAFRKWRGIDQKGHFCIWPKSNDFSMTSEMAFTESLLLRKGHFLSRKRGRLFKKYFFRSLLFSLLKKVGGGHMPPLPPPPGSAAPANECSYELTDRSLFMGGGRDVFLGASWW
jgi:hypothetical protein